jgi:hypothetical protein
MRTDGVGWGVSVDHVQGRVYFFLFILHNYGIRCTETVTRRKKITIRNHNACIQMLM